MQIHVQKMREDKHFHYFIIEAQEPFPENVFIMAPSGIYVRSKHHPEFSEANESFWVRGEGVALDRAEFKAPIHLVGQFIYDVQSLMNYKFDGRRTRSDGDPSPFGETEGVIIQIMWGNFGRVFDRAV